MKSTIYLGLDSKNPVKVNAMTFSGGEVQVKIDKPWDINEADLVVVYVKLRCAEGIQALAQLRSIIEHYKDNPQINLLMGYTPYSRQDRVCAEGESNAVKVFANQINAMNFHKVVTLDNHSDVATAVLDSCANMTKEDLFENAAIPYQNYDVFVAPDYGAAKEVQALATKYGKEFVQGFKKRDPKTGALSGFGHYAPEGFLDGKSVLIIDDLCDGGGTFLGLAEDLRDVHRFMGSLSLYVTHGIFSKGTKLLTDKFSDVYTTDTLIDDDDLLDSEVTVIKILEI